MSRAASIVLACLGLLQTGCIAVAAGAATGYGTAQYLRNEVTRDFGASYSTTFAAAVSTMRASGYGIAAEATAEASGGRLESGDTAVRVEALSECSTRVHVRIGTFSTEDHRCRAGAILDGIGTRLGAP